MMFKPVIIIFICVSITHNSARAEALACQGIWATGLEWTKKSWETTEYRLGSHQRKFILKVDDITGEVAKESVAKLLKSEKVNCHETYPGTQSCTDLFGGHFYFGKRTLNGAISQISGASEKVNEGYKDSMYIMPFQCEKF